MLYLNDNNFIILLDFYVNYCKNIYYFILVFVFEYYFMNIKIEIKTNNSWFCELLKCPTIIIFLLICFRYSESHNCSYDYQKNGRDSIEKNNPLIVRPKLPKI